MVVIGATMPAELVKAMRERAERADRSFSAELRCAIRSHIANSETPTGQVEVSQSSRGQARHGEG
jgi:plasmid stability protein